MKQKFLQKQERVLLNIRLNDDKRNQLKEIADQVGLSMSEVIRQTLDKYLFA